MDLSNFIYDFNLFSTETVNDIQQGCLIINNGRRREIDYWNSVSLYELVEKFNKSYLDYLKDGFKLKNVIEPLGEDVSYISHIASEDFTSLCLDVSNPHSTVFDERNVLVYLVNNSGDYYAFADNGRRRSDEKYKSDRVLLDYGSIVTGLDIVKRNCLFLDAYKDLKNKFIFGNGTTVIFSKIEQELFDELSTFTLTFGNSYMNREDFIEVKFRLGDNLEILYDESKVIIYDEEITDIEKKKQVIKELLSSLYVNRDRLNGLYQNHDDKKVFVKENK